MKQAWFTSVTPEERDQSLAVLRKSYPGIEAHAQGHTNEQDAHVNPFIVVRYEGGLPVGPAHFNESPEFPALQEAHNLIEGVDVPEWE